MPADFRFVGLKIDHPGARERLRGDQSQVSVVIDRGLRGGRLDFIPLDEMQLLGLVKDGATYLEILRRRESRDA